MRQSNKQHRQQRRIQEPIEVEPIDYAILDSISSPNPWTPKAEVAWLNEVCKLPVEEIYRRFPPLRKPSNVRMRGKGMGWG